MPSPITHDASDTAATTATTRQTPKGSCHRSRHGPLIYLGVLDVMLGSNHDLLMRFPVFDGIFGGRCNFHYHLTP